MDDLRNNILDWKNSVENVQENNSCTKARWCEGHLLLLLFKKWCTDLDTSKKTIDNKMTKRSVCLYKLRKVE